MSDAVTAMVAAAITIAVLMLAAWLVSLALRNASIVDATRSTTVRERPTR